MEKNRIYLPVCICTGGVPSVMELLYGIKAYVNPLWQTWKLAVICVLTYLTKGELSPVKTSALVALI
jgi:hypothetical protein